MATNFPASLDSLTNPTSSDSLNSPSHSAQHANVNDAVEALQAKVGVDSSAVTSSLDYKVAQLEGQGTWTAFTPSWNNVTVGNATQSFFYCVLNKTVIIRGQFVFGSTSSFTGIVSMNVPYETQVADPGVHIGAPTFNDLNTGDLFIGHSDGSGQTIRFWSVLANGTYLARSGSQLAATHPFTWATGDFLRVDATYRIS